MTIDGREKTTDKVLTREGENRLNHRHEKSSLLKMARGGVMSAKKMANNEEKAQSYEKFASIS